MTPFSTIVLVCAVAILTGCDESVRSDYATRTEAESDNVFDRGWLPEIIPSSSREIMMKNDLDLNLTEGEFKFATPDHDAFIEHLDRSKSYDVKGFSAYTYEDWIFLISDSRDHCRFSMKLSRK